MYIAFYLHDYFTVLTILFSKIGVKACRWQNFLKVDYKIYVKWPPAWKIFENWYLPVLEEGFSFFEIQTPLENSTPANQNVPPES